MPIFFEALEARIFLSANASASAGVRLGGPLAFTAPNNSVSVSVNANGSGGAGASGGFPALAGPLHFYTALAGALQDQLSPQGLADFMAIGSASLQQSLWNAFSTQFYLANNPDVAAAVARGGFVSAFDHFIRYGNREWRNPSATINQAALFRQNPSLAAAVSRGLYASPLDAYLAQPALTTPVAPPTPPPTAPAVVARNLSSSAISLTWTETSTPITAFTVLRSIGNEPFSQVATVPGTAFTYVDTGLTDGRTYRYEIVAHNGALTSAPSAIASATTTLAAPDGLTATQPTASSVYLAWTDHSSTATNVLVQRSTDGAHFATIATLAASVNAYANTGLADGTVYGYEVVAENGSLLSAPSTATSVTTALLAPTGLAAAAPSAGTIDLTWADQSATATNVLVQRAADGVHYATIATPAATATAYVDPGLADGTTYYYRLIAQENATQSPPSAGAQAITILPAPTGLAAVPAPGPTVDLTWTEPSTAATGFTILRSMDGTHFASIAAVGGTTTSYADTNAMPTTLYYYEVYATNAIATSANSLAASATTVAFVGIQNGDFSGNAGSYAVDVGYGNGYPDLTYVTNYNTNPVTRANNGNPTNPTDWNVSSGNAGVNGADTGVGNVFGPASTTGVSDFAFMQNNGSAEPTFIYQTVSTVAGQTYSLGYAYGARDGDAATALTATVFDGTPSTVVQNGVNVLSGTVIASQATTPSDLTITTNPTFTFTAVSNTTTIEFLNSTANNVGNGDNTVDVSNVALTGVY